MEKKIYKSPTLKVVEFKAEQGFAGSAFSLNNTTTPNEFEMEFDENGARNEGYFFNDGQSFWD